MEAFQFIYDLVHTHRVMLTKEEADAGDAPRQHPLAGGQGVGVREQLGAALTQPRANAPGVRVGRGPHPAGQGRGAGGGAPLEREPHRDLEGQQAAGRRPGSGPASRPRTTPRTSSAGARPVTAALKRSLTIPDGFEIAPPAHVSVFRAVKFEDSGSWHYHPRFQEAEQIASRELTAAFKKEKTLRQALQDIDVACNAIMDRQV